MVPLGVSWIRTLFGRFNWRRRVWLISQRATGCRECKTKTSPPMSMRTGFRSSVPCPWSCCPSCFESSAIKLIIPSACGRFALCFARPFRRGKEGGGVEGLGGGRREGSSQAKPADRAKRSAATSLSFRASTGAVPTGRASRPTRPSVGGQRHAQSGSVHNGGKEVGGECPDSFNSSSIGQGQQKRKSLCIKSRRRCRLGRSSSSTTSRRQAGKNLLRSRSQRCRRHPEGRMGRAAWAKGSSVRPCPRLRSRR